MPYDGYSELSVKEFGGLNTLSNPTDLPQFMSPNCQNVEFIPGRVQTRPGTSKAFSTGSSANINYTKSYQMLNGSVRNLAYDSLGNLSYEDVTNSPGSDSLITGNLLTGLFPNSTTLFGKEWLALGDGKQGQDIPRQYDGTNLDPISQDGPAAAPQVFDDVVSLNTLVSPSGLKMDLTQNIKASPNGLSEAAGICTLATQGGAGSFFGALPGDQILISGAGVSGYNGTFTILTVTKFQPTSTDITITFQNSNVGLANSGGGTVQFQLAHVFLSAPHGLPLNFGAPFNPSPNVTIAGAPVTGYNGTWQVRNTPATQEMYVAISSFGLAASGTATVTVIGDIVGGTHQVSVMFQTRSGYITRPAPPGSWVAGGSKRAKVINIPIGPPNVVARILIFTPVSSGQFFWIPTSGASVSMPTTIISDNTTTTAFVNFSDESLLNGEAANDFFDLIVLGEAAGISEYNSRLVVWGMANKIQNFLNIGFDGGFSQGTQQVPLGWTPDPANYSGGGKAPVSVTGDAYSITGDGIHATQGLITQGAVKDYLGNTILSPATAYTIAFRATKTAISSGAQLFVQLSSPSSAYLQGAVINVGTQLFIGSFALLTANCLALPAQIASDLVVQVYATNLGNAEAVYVDCIEFVPTNQPVETSVVRFSNVEDPESFNGLTGFIQPSDDNGQAIRNVFIIRDFLYINKERSLFITRDDGQNEPDAWEVDEVSKAVGTPSPRGIGTGDEWVPIAAQSGLWLFSGGQLTPDSKMSQEIQPTWDSINWNLGHLIDVKVDTRRKRIYVNVPLGASATQNNTVLTLDYTQGFGDPAGNNGIGRKWCPWTLSANAINLCLQQDNSLVLYVGANFGDGTIYKLNPAQLNDYDVDLVPINAFWESGYFQNGSRLDFGYLRSNAVGAGLLNLTLYKGEQVWPVNVRGWNLSTMGVHDMERQLNLVNKRAAVQFSQNAVGSFFQIQGFSLYAMTSPFSPMRGINVTT